ncbi:MAG: TIM barrel protein [Gemmatimonadota bacterium]|nr:TIM barrel protein [Gemmatimonadota bacterium]
MTSYSRRDFARLALFGLPAARLFSAVRRPNYLGIQIGLNVPYSFGNNNMSADDVLKNCVALGVGALELRSQPVEAFMGAPAPAARAERGADSTARAAAAAVARSGGERLRDWRLATSPDGAIAFRKKYEDAGVKIEIVKFDNIYAMTDGELDFAFGVARSLGARAISCEISTKDDDLRRVGSFADKHRMMVGYHGHTKVTPAIWEHAFSLGKYNGANVDIGHFIAGNNYSPVEFIKKHHDRITHVHIKDRKLNEGPNVPFGQGDTPIVKVLRLIRDNGWPMQATIEFEYPVPPGSDRMTEIAKSLKYCRDAVM